MYRIFFYVKKIVKGRAAVLYENLRVLERTQFCNLIILTYRIDGIDLQSELSHMFAIVVCLQFNRKLTNLNLRYYF